MARIGIFGGSFDPVHAGHVGIAKRAVREIPLDRIIVVPAARSPFKTSDDAAPMFSPQERLERLRRAFAGMPEAEIDTRELERGGVSYAIDTVREIAAENPGDSLFFIVGEDAMRDVGKWKDGDALLRLCTFVSFPRTPESSTAIRRALRKG